MPAAVMSACCPLGEVVEAAAGAWSRRICRTTAGSGSARFAVFSAITPKMDELVDGAAP